MEENFNEKPDQVPLQKLIPTIGGYLRKQVQYSVSLLHQNSIFLPCLNSYSKKYPKPYR